MAPTDERYRFNNLTPPHKVHEATKYIKPIIDSFTEALKPILKYRTAYQDTQHATTDAAHQLQELPEEAAKYNQKLRTLEDNLPVRDDDEEEVPTSSQKKPMVDPQPKRRRSTKTKEDNSKDNLTKLLTQPINVLQQNNNIKPPLSLTTMKSWTINIKKIIPEDMHQAFDQHCEKMRSLLNEANHNKPTLQEMATRWGLPFSLVASAGATMRTLHAISVITFFAL